MIQRLLPYLFSIFFVLSSHGADDSNSDLVEGILGEQTSLLAEDASNKYDGKKKSAHSSQSLLMMEEPESVPDLDLEFFENINKTVFRMDDPASHKICRWAGRTLGLMAEQAIVPMVLYVLLNLINLPADSPQPWVDSMVNWGIVTFSLIYFLLPSTENMALMGQDVAEWIEGIRDGCAFSEKQDAPQPSSIPRSIPSFDFWAPFPSSAILFNTATHLHAGVMALILTTVFKQIEGDEYKWFFWTFGGPYAVLIYAKNVYFFQQGQRRKMRWLRRSQESYQEQKARKVLETSLKKFDQTLPQRSQNDLKEMYKVLSNKTKTGAEKIHSFLENTPTTIKSEIISNLEKTVYHRPLNPRERLSKEITNIAFYASLMGEYFFYLYGIQLACTHFGLGPGTAQTITSHISSGLLTFFSLLFEDESMDQYYRSIFQESFGSPYSASNVTTRKMIGIQSFLFGGLISLSEVYPAWKATLTGSNVQYPLLILMVARHHARNASWLRQGYEYFLSNVHGRDCWRDRCDWQGCQKGNNKEEMLNFISQCSQKLRALTDRAPAAKVTMIYKAHFGHSPAQN